MPDIPAENPLIVLGIISGPHGVKGDLKVRGCGEILRNAGLPLTVQVCSGRSESGIAHCSSDLKSFRISRRSGSGDILYISADEIADRDAAGFLSGMLVTMPLDQIKSDFPGYLTDLLYLPVRRSESEPVIGYVEAIRENPAHPLFQISVYDRNDPVLIPYVAELVRVSGDCLVVPDINTFMEAAQ